MNNVRRNSVGAKVSGSRHAMRRFFSLISGEITNQAVKAEALLPSYSSLVAICGLAEVKVRYD